MVNEKSQPTDGNYGHLNRPGLCRKWLFRSETAESGLLLAASLIGGFPIAESAWQALKVKVISIDLLVTLAILGAFVIQEFEGNPPSWAFPLLVLGAYLEQKTLAKTRSAIKELVEMVPETALRQTADGDFEEVDLDDLDEGDILLVKTGGKIPVDGEVVSGSGTANEASITGESMPLGKKPGDPVYAGTILENGTIRIKAEKVGDETTFGKIIELVEELVLHGLSGVVSHERQTPPIARHDAIPPIVIILRTALRHQGSLKVFPSNGQARFDGRIYRVAPVSHRKGLVGLHPKRHTVGFAFLNGQITQLQTTMPLRTLYRIGVVRLQGILA